MSEPEFYANATLGFRQWYLTLGDGENDLPSLDGVMMKYGFPQNRYHWSPEGFNHAECW